MPKKTSEIAFKHNYLQFVKTFCGPEFQSISGLTADSVYQSFANGLRQAGGFFAQLPTNQNPNSECYKRVFYNEHGPDNRPRVKTFERISEVERRACYAAGEDVIEIPDRRFAKDANFTAAQRALTPFFDIINVMMVEAIRHMMEKKGGQPVPYIFWSYTGARDCALKWCEDNGGGIMMNNTIGSLMNDVTFKDIDPNNPRWFGEIWVSFSEIYARKAAQYVGSSPAGSPLRLMNFIGPGAGMTETVWAQMESPTLSQISETLYSNAGAGQPQASRHNFDDMIQDWYVVPTRAEDHNGKSIINWTGETTVHPGPNYVQHFTNKAQALRALPTYSNEQLKNSWIILS